MCNVSNPPDLPLDFLITRASRIDRLATDAKQKQNDYRRLNFFASQVNTPRPCSEDQHHAEHQTVDWPDHKLSVTDSRLSQK